MANRTPRFHDQALAQGDRVLWVEISPGVYALATAAVISSETGSVIAEIDEITSALVTIPVIHRKVHEGVMFSVSYKAPDAVPIADNGTIIFMLTVGAREVDVVAQIAAGGDAQLELGEGATFDDDGTAMVEYNRRRVSTTTATVEAVRDPTLTLAGTILDDMFIPGGTGGNSIGSVGGQRIEWALAPGIIYMIRATNRAGNAQPMSLEAVWYEK